VGTREKDLKEVMLHGNPRQRGKSYARVEKRNFTEKTTYLESQDEDFGAKGAKGR